MTIDFDIAAREQLTFDYDVKISEPPSFVEAQPNDINFFDWDGKIVESWSLDELQEKTEFPDIEKIRTHKGIVFDGWNYDIRFLKYSPHPMDVGAFYRTDDGKTRIYINVRKERLTYRLCLNTDGNVNVDWGDKSQYDVLVGTDLKKSVFIGHTYSSEGNYVISLESEANIKIIGESFIGSMLLRYDGSLYSYNFAALNSIKKIEFGIHKSIDINSYAFEDCNSLEYVAVSSKTYFSGLRYFSKCYSLKYITFNTRTSNISEEAFYECSSLDNISFGNVSAISKNAFYNCYSLYNIKLPIYMSVFEESCFSNCCSVTYLFIPFILSDISNSVFQRMYGVKIFDFSTCMQVPSLSNSNAFAGLSNDYVIKVPANLLDEWKAAPNWSNIARHIQS